MTNRHLNKKWRCHDLAERRMFAKTVIDSDAFLDMPVTAQLLYFHLAMRADDDGFINKPKTIMRMCGCKEDDMKVLFAKQYIIPFESGIVVIKHWKIHNYIQKDRYKPTNLEERKQVELDENMVYQPITDCHRAIYNADTECIQAVSGTDTQVRLGKDRLDILADKPPTQKRKAFTLPTVEEVKAYCAERNNSIDAQHFVDYYTANGWKVGKNPMKDWKAAIRTWERNDAKKQNPNQTTEGGTADGTNSRIYEGII